MRVQSFAGRCAVLLLSGLSLSACQRGKPGAEGQAAASASASPATPDTPEKVVAAFYTDLKQGDFKKALSWYSQYSSEHLKVDFADEVRAREKTFFAGTKVIDYKVVDKREPEPGVVLVSLWEKRQTGTEPPETTDQTFVLRHEADGWRINWNGLIEYRAVHVAGQTIKKVSLQPFLVERFLDGVKVHLKVSNGNGQDTVHWSWVGRKTAQLKYADGSTQQLEGTHLSFGPNESQDVWIKLDGYAKSFPTELLASQFAFGIRFLEGKVPGDANWSYRFELPSEGAAAQAARQ